MPSDPLHLTRLDNDDTALNTWVLAWVAGQISRNPLGLFEAPIFFPAHDPWPTHACGPSRAWSGRSARSGCTRPDGRTIWRPLAAFITTGGVIAFLKVLGSMLALVAVARGVTWTDLRARMALAFGVSGFALSFGASLPGYEWLQTYIPLFQGIRAAARWGFLFLIAIAILAGYGVAMLEHRVRTYSW
jgi:hypothetical protein